jgi:hypothetical protein
MLIGRMAALEVRTDLVKGVGDIKNRRELLIYCDIERKLQGVSGLIEKWDPTLNRYDNTRYLALFQRERVHFRKTITYDEMNIVVNDLSTEMKLILMSINMPSKIFSSRRLYSSMQGEIEKRKFIPPRLFGNPRLILIYYYGPLVRENILHTITLEGKFDHGLLCLILAEQERNQSRAIKYEDFDLEIQGLAIWNEIIEATEEIRNTLDNLKDNIGILINIMQPWKFPLTDSISDHLRAVLFCLNNNRINLKLNWVRSMMFDFNISFSIIFLCKLLTIYPCFFIPAYILEAATEIFIHLIDIFRDFLRFTLERLDRDLKRVLFSNVRLLLETIGSRESMKASFFGDREEKVKRHIEYIREQDESKLKPADTAHFSNDINILFMEDQLRALPRATFRRMATYCIHIWR